MMLQRVAPMKMMDLTLRLKFEEHDLSSKYPEDAFLRDQKTSILVGE